MRPQMNRKPKLPIDHILHRIAESLATHPSLAIEAAPGAGKTTRAPVTLLNIVAGEVVVLELRRIAARLAARWVSSELGEPVGTTVGYQVRFEEAVGPRTRLRFVTEGVTTTANLESKHRYRSIQPIRCLGFDCCYSNREENV